MPLSLMGFCGNRWSVPEICLALCSALVKKLSTNTKVRSVRYVDVLGSSRLCFVVFVNSTHSFSADTECVLAEVPAVASLYVLDTNFINKCLMNNFQSGELLKTTCCVFALARCTVVRCLPVTDPSYCSPLFIHGGQIWGDS